MKLEASSSKAGQSSNIQYHHLNIADGPSANIADQECTTVAVLAVPPWMNTSDFLAFVAPSSEAMAHLRLIRDACPNRTMAVIQFRDAKSADEFVEEFNGKQYNSIEVNLSHNSSTIANPCNLGGNMYNCARQVY